MRRPQPFALLLCLLSGAAQADGEWRPVRKEADGLILEARAVDGSDFEELRVRVRVEAPLKALADLVWTWRPDGVEARMVERRVVLSEGPGERVVYQLLHPPLVSKRQSLIRVRRQASEQSRSVRISFVSLPGPLPELQDAIRVTVRGEWSFEADGTRATWVDYRCLSDPGGGLPAWLVAGAQQDIALQLVREVAHRTP